MSDMRFDGSVWCNIDVTLRNLEAIYTQQIESMGLTVVEWYIMRTLYEEDGQMASRLADAVGRAATSFTPILDKLEAKGYIERRSHPSDRRAILVYLTKKGRSIEKEVMASLDIENKLRQQFKNSDWQAFQNVVTSLQTMKT